MDILKEQLSIFLPLLFGLILGWHAHRLTSRREHESRLHASNISRNARLADYESFLLDWEQRIERSSPEEIAKAYATEGAAAFRSRAALVRRDFVDRKMFTQLDDSFS